MLITGANGFVGKHLVTALHGAGHNVIATGTETQDSSGADAYFAADLMQRAEVDGLSFHEIDGVIHLAGLAAVGPSFGDPLRYLNVNMGAQTNLFEAAIAQSAKPRFLVISSGSLYDPKAELPLTEDSSVMPNSPYAVSKLGQEQLAQYYNSRGIPTILARPFNHIGPGQSVGFIVPDLAQQIVAQETADHPVIKVGNLAAKRDYTDVRDIAKAYVALIEDGRPGEMYNVCSGRSVSGEEILHKMLRLTGKDFQTESDPAKIRPADVADIYGSAGKLNRDTGWVPTIPLEQTLTDALADWRAK